MSWLCTRDWPKHRTSRVSPWFLWSLKGATRCSSSTASSAKRRSQKCVRSEHNRLEIWWRSAASLWDQVTWGHRCKWRSMFAMCVDLRCTRWSDSGNSTLCLSVPPINAKLIGLRVSLSCQSAHLNLWVFRTSRSRSQVTRCLSAMCLALLKLGHKARTLENAHPETMWQSLASLCPSLFMGSEHLV